MKAARIGLVIALAVAALSASVWLPYHAGVRIVRHDGHGAARTATLAMTPTPGTARTAPDIIAAVRASRPGFCTGHVYDRVAGPRYFNGRWLLTCETDWGPAYTGISGSFECLVVSDATLEILAEPGVNLYRGPPFATQEASTLDACAKAAGMTTTPPAP